MPEPSENSLPGASSRNALMSVIMPCYNATPYVKQAMESVLSESHGNVELIFVDDASTDPAPRIAADLAEQCAGRIALLHTHRPAPYAARNLGLAHATGEL